MSTIVGAILFLLKAMAYGVGLAFGFWLCGKFTVYADFYINAVIAGKFHKPITQEGFGGRTYAEELAEEPFMKPLMPMFEVIKKLSSLEMQLKS
jgi:hypothetical protein